MRHLTLSHRRSQCMDFGVLLSASYYVEIEALVAFCGGAHQTYREFVSEIRDQKIALGTDLKSFEQNTKLSSELQHRVKMRSELLKGSIDGLLERREQSLECIICTDDINHRYSVCCRYCYHACCFQCFLLFRAEFDRCAMCRRPYTNTPLSDLVILRPQDGQRVVKVRYKLDALRWFIKKRKNKDISLIIVTSESNHSFVEPILKAIEERTLLTTWSCLEKMLFGMTEAIDLLLYDDENIFHSIPKGVNINLIVRYIIY